MKINKKTCFTLIELLVVIAIISILMTMLLPALKHVKDRGKETVCKGNQKQIGLAMQMYASDYNGDLPQIGYCWYESMLDNPERRSSGRLNDGSIPEGLGHFYPDYLPDGKVFYCPSGTAITYENPAATAATGWTGSASTATGYCSYTMRGLANDFKISKYSDWGAGADLGFWFRDSRPKNHTTGYNILFYDGHVKWYKNEKDSLYPATGDQTYKFYYYYLNNY